MESENILASKPIGKLMLKLAIPTVLAQLVNLLYNIVDRIFVGHINEIGSLALAGLGVTFPIIIFIGAFSALFGTGGAPRAAIAMGCNDNERAEKILGNCTMMLIICSIILSVFFMITKDKILIMFGASENTLPYASSYITIYLIGTMFLQLTLGLNAFITNQGFTKTSMITICIGAVLNIILDPIFIFVFHLGVQGAALATIISQGISCIWVLKFLTGNKTHIKIRIKNLRLSKQIVFLVISLGISPFVMQSTDCFIQLVFNNGMLKYGNDSYVALMSILFSVMQLVWMPMQGFAQGVQPIISFNYGAGNNERVFSAFKKLFILCLVFSMSIIVILELFPQFFIGMFTSDAQIIEIGKNAIRVFMLSMSLMGMQTACQHTFLALGQAKESVFLAIERKLILLLPLALILPKIGALGVWGLFVAEPISDFIAVLTTVSLFSVKSRKLLTR